MRILLINEHSIPGHHNEYELEQSGYNVDIFHNISDGYAALKFIPYSAVIKDITTPDEMELTMLHQWRKKKHNHAASGYHRCQLSLVAG